ncbi:MAG: hypothetical protein NTZ67_01780 [Gammaproteobacteria bacterium]|nr:hypothetical protein [Gammaproteobacteria bacterium]
MNMNPSVKRILCCMAITGMLAGCNEYRQSTSYYGSGAYHCFYQNTRTQAVYKTKDPDIYQSALTGKKTCRKAAVSENDEAHCEFKECVFK